MDAKRCNIIELMASIGEKGYSYAEPLLVVKSKKNNNKYEVVEGNRRLTALKLLFNPELASIKRKSIQQVFDEAEEHPKEVPVIEYSKREDILDYLGFRHITGVKPWNPLAKARYLKQLKDSLKDLSPDEENKSLAKTIGSNSKHVKLLLTALEIYEEISDRAFFKIPNLSEEEIDFGTLYTGIMRQNIAGFIGVDLSSEPAVKKLNTKNLSELTDWMFRKNDQNRTRLGESRNLGKLDKVISNKDSLQAFRSGSPLDDAVKLTEDVSEIFRKSLLEALDNLKIAANYIAKINKPTATEEKALEEISIIVEDLIVLVRKRLK